jgi:hypothetical protein
MKDKRDEKKLGTRRQQRIYGGSNMRFCKAFAPAKRSLMGFIFDEGDDLLDRLLFVTKSHFVLLSPDVPGCEEEE